MFDGAAFNTIGHITGTALRAFISLCQVVVLNYSSEISSPLQQRTECFKPITKWQILDSSKLKEFADDNFKFDENGRKLSKWVENTVAKGEIAHYEQFLLFPQCLQKACFPGASKGVIVWELVNEAGTKGFSLQD